jgi:hypothetical protein
MQFIGGTVNLFSRSLSDDDEASFARWCLMMCVNRLKRRLRLGLPLSRMARRTLARFDVPLRVATSGTAPVLELVNEIVDPPIDLGAMYEALTTLLVHYARRQAQPA